VIFDSGSVADLGAALLGAVTTHASELGATAIRWQQVSETDEHIAALFTDAAELAKVRFELPIPVGEAGVTSA